MPAGYEMDALIAEKVMGCGSIYQKGTRYYCACEDGIHSKGHLTGDRNEEIKFYSVDISAAWEVVEWLRNQNLFIQMTLWDFHNGIYNQYCVEASEGIEGYGETAPLAICRAAAKAALIVGKAEGES